jgi:ribosomal-protein-alanine N-acetyltransferase
MIRQATAKDLDRIAFLSLRILGNPGTKDEYETALNEDSLGIYVLELEQEIQGYVLYRLEGEDSEIDEIVIKKEMEGKGLGKMLLEEVLAKLSLEHPGTCFLEVRKRNQRAIALYERVGFEFYRERKHYYPDDDALCYKKRF